MSGPPVIIVSGPSGSGKSTVIARLLAEGGLPLHLSVSATTRPRRAGERDGVHYHFWTPERFEEQVRQGEFVEWATVHGASYGTLWSEVEPFRKQGMLVILDIDVQGAAQVRTKLANHVSIFLRAPSLEMYEKRLRQRGTEDEAAIQCRLESARRELTRVREYDFEVVNDSLESAVAQVRAILERRLERDAHAG